MSHPPSFPAPPSSRPTEPASSSMQNAQAQSASHTERTSQRMSISSLLTDRPIPTPRDSITTSTEDHHTAKAPQAPTPESTTQPVNGSAVAANDAEISTTPERLSSLDTRREANGHRQSATSPVSSNSLDEAPVNSPFDPVSHKGKGRDPELYDIDPTVHANTQPRREDGSADDDAAETMLKLQLAPCDFQAAHTLLDLHAKHVLSSSAVEHEPDHLDSSESEDEGPLPSADAAQRSFTIRCHGKDVGYRANQGNAVFDLLPSRWQRQRIIDQRAERSCYHCETIRVGRRDTYEAGYRSPGCVGFQRDDMVPLEHDDLDRWNTYEAGYRSLGCVGFQRDVTVPLEDDDDADIAVVDRPMDEEHGAADEEEDDSSGDDAYPAPAPGTPASPRRAVIKRPYTTPRPSPAAKRTQRQRQITATARTATTMTMTAPSPLKQVQNVSSESESVHQQQLQHDDDESIVGTGGKAASSEREIKGKGRKESGRLGEREAEEVREFRSEFAEVRFMYQCKVKSARKRGESAPTTPFLIAPSMSRPRPRRPKPQPIIPQQSHQQQTPPLPLQQPTDPLPAPSSRKRKAPAPTPAIATTTPQKLPEPTRPQRRNLWQNSTGPATATRSGKAEATAEQQRMKEEAAMKMREKAEMEMRKEKMSEAGKPDRARMGHMLSLIGFRDGDDEEEEDEDEVVVEGALKRRRREEEAEMRWR